jgi:hypothetical protein
LAFALQLGQLQFELIYLSLEFIIFLSDEVITGFYKTCSAQDWVAWEQQDLTQDNVFSTCEHVHVCGRLIEFYRCHQNLMSNI